MINVLTVPAGNAHTARRPHYSRGSGIIISKNNNLFLKTGNDTIPLDAAMKEYVTTGETVRYQMNDSSITLIISDIIDKLPDGTFPKDTAIFSKSTESPDLANKTQTLTTESPLRPGLYVFTDSQEALAFLSLTKNDTHADHIRSVITTFGNIVLMVDSTTHQVSFFSPDEAATLLQTLRGLFQSDVLQTLPLEHMLNILTTTGTIDFEKLSVLDTFLSNSSINSVAARAGSHSMRNNMLSIWLQTALDSSLSPVAMASMFPDTTIDTLITDVRDINARLVSASGVPPFVTEDYCIDTQKITTTETNQFLEKAISDIGFAFEHKLAQTGTTDIQKQFKTFKAELLSLITNIASHSESKHGSNPQPIDTSENSNDAKWSSRMKPSIPEGVSVNKPLLNEINALISATDTLITSNQTHSQYNMTMSPLSNTISSSSENIPSSASTPPDEGISLLQSVVGHIKSLSQRILSYKETDELMRSIARTINQESSNCLQALSSEETHTIKTFHSSMLPSVPHVITKNLHILNAIIKELDLLSAVITAKLITAPSEDGKKSEKHVPAATDSQQRVSENNQAAAKQHSETDSALQKSSGHEFASKIKQTLSSLESFQLLARQTDAGESTRQMFALPVKIGEEITEMLIQLHNFSKSKKRASTISRFSVDIGIAPSRLGSIQTHLDYLTASSLKIQMQFEHKKTLRWFERSQTDLLPLLEKSFNVPIQLILQLQKKYDLKESHQQLSEEAVIDIKV